MPGVSLHYTHLNSSQFSAKILRIERFLMGKSNFAGTVQDVAT